jgi:hypothetical protein
MDKIKIKIRIYKQIKKMSYRGFGGVISGSHMVVK